VAEQRLARPNLDRRAGILFGGAVDRRLSPASRVPAAIIARFIVAGSVALFVLLPHSIWFALAARLR
jgi:hypothetical protein